MLPDAVVAAGPAPLDHLRVALVLALAVAQAVAAFWPDLRGHRHTIATRSAALVNPVVPVGPTFAIWGPIFLSCIAFALWQAWPANHDDPLARSIGWTAAGLFAANTAWELWVPRRGLDRTSVVLILVELGLAVWLLFAVTSADLSGRAWWLIALPFSLFAGWVTAATFVNLSSTLLGRHRSASAEAGAQGRGVDPRRPAVALALIGSTAALGLVVTLASGSLPYALGLAWALAGIALANRSRRPLAGAAVAAALSVVVAASVSPAHAASPTGGSTVSDPATAPADDVRTVRTDALEIAYLERGPADGPVTVLVHGFPDDATGWLPVMDALADAGRRTLAPYLRGFGPTRFLDPETPRSGQLAALVADLVGFMDALDVERATLVGHDWGARATQGVAALHPDRVERLVSYGGYAISFGEGSGPPPYPVLRELWYQHLLNMPFADGLLHGDADGFARYLWSQWSPGWDGREVAFGSIAPFIANPDFVPVVLSGYSYTGAGFDPALADLEAHLAEGPTVDVPTTIVRGGRDPLETPAEFAHDGVRFAAIERSIGLPDAGHFAHRQRPDVAIEVLLNAKR